MRKRTVIVLSGMLLCSMGGYVAWCWRPFYLPAGLSFDADVSPGGRKAAERWRWHARPALRLEFNWPTAWKNLCYPWDCELAEPVEVEEQSNSGLWAMKNGKVWGFSRTGGEWDAATAHDHSFSIWSSYAIYRQGELGSRIDVFQAEGCTMEVLSLGRLTDLGRVFSMAGQVPDGGGNSPDVFYDREVLGSIMVEKPEDRQRLLEGLARSIREAVGHDEAERLRPKSRVKLRVTPKVRSGYGAEPTGIEPRYGVILTTGDMRAEYLIDFDGGDAEAFDQGIDGIDGPDWTLGKRNRGYFRISSRAKGDFDAFLKRNGVEQKE